MKGWNMKSRNKQKRIIKALRLMLILVLETAMLSSLWLLPGKQVNAAEADEIPSRMKKIASTDSLELYFDEALTDIAVRVKDSGDIWFSNPQGADEDPVAGTFYKNLMKAQFSLRYYNQSVQASEMDNYNDAIANGQFSFLYTENGVQITYNLGEVADKYILPWVISGERYELYTGLMEKDVAKKVSRNYICLNPDEMKEEERKAYTEKYPSLEQGVIYVLGEGTKEYKKEELTEYFAAVGYTAEEMYRDNEENGFESVSQKAWFNVTLEYALDADALIAKIDPEKIEYDTEKYALVDIDLLEYFGAAGADEDGYLFVPDGSGALIYTNNGKTSVPAYLGAVYGEDKTGILNNERKSEIDQAVTVRMPVFGLKKGDRAFFAIVEEGEAGADINAEVAGKTDSYNNVYAGFTYLSSGKISLSEVVGSHGFQMYSQPVFSEPFSVRYLFLHGDGAGYPGMAACYQEYLVKRGVLGERVTQTATPLYLDLIGAVQKWKSVMGIKYMATQELTTYGQAWEMLQQLSEQGVDNLKVMYSGWSSGGLHGTAPGGVKALGCLNADGMNLKQFLEHTNSAGIPVFHSVQLQYVWKEGMFDGYSKEKHAPRYYDKTVVSAYSYLIPNGYRTSENRSMMISPYFVESMTDTLLKKVDGYHLQGMNVQQLSSNLFSDFYDKRYTDRQMAAAQNGAAMQKLAEAYDRSVMGENANAYAWQYLSDIAQVPFDSNRAQIIDEVVPFYEMVLHGYKSFSGEALNLADDFTMSVLKSVECGSGITFRLIWEDNSLLKNTEFDYLYSVSYEVWKDKAVETWQKVNDATGSLQDKRIVNHEKLSEGVYRTTFEDGTEIIVNYNRSAVQYQGKTVDAQDFLVERKN